MFVDFAQPTRATESSRGAFDDPAARQAIEVRVLRAMFDELQVGATVRTQLTHPRDHGVSIAAVGLDAARGDASVGVQRQYCGRLGRPESWQVGVFASLGRGPRAALVGLPAVPAGGVGAGFGGFCQGQSARGRARATHPDGIGVCDGRRCPGSWIEQPGRRRGTKSIGTITRSPRHCTTWAESF